MFAPRSTASVAVGKNVMLCLLQCTATSKMEFVLLLLSLLAVVMIISVHSWYCSPGRMSKNQKSCNFITTDGESKSLAPYPTQPIKGRDRYRVLMDIRKLDVGNWLTLDANYLAEHRIRSQLLEQKKHNVLECLPESYEACQEVLDEVSGFLCRRYPEIFEVEYTASGGIEMERSIHNKLTGETLAVGGTSHRADALEKAVRLTSEDLSVLMTNQDDEYYLCGYLASKRTKACANSSAERPVRLCFQSGGPSTNESVGQ